MKHTFISFAVALCCGFAGSAMAAGNTADAAGMSKADYKAQKQRIDGDYKAAKDKCGPLKGNAQDICKAEAKGKHDVAKAELEEQYKPSPRHEAKVKTEQAEADYKVAKQKCDDLSGNQKSVCKKDAKAAYDSAKGEAKATKTAEKQGANSTKAAGAAGAARDDKMDAQYSAAKARCDAMSGQAKTDCMTNAKKEYGKM